MPKRDYESREAEFVNWLKQLAKEKDDNSQKRATLAILRRGLGRFQGKDFFLMYPLLGRYLPHDGLEWDNRIYFIVASLFAQHPFFAEEGNMGRTLAEVKKRIEQKTNTKNESTDKRFIALLSCHRDDLHKHLRHIISLAKSNEVGVNWGRLLNDIRFWNWGEGKVQRDWAHNYWTYHSNPEEVENVIESNEDNIIEEV